MPKFKKRPVTVEAYQLDVYKQHDGSAWWSDVLNWAQRQGAEVGDWVVYSKDGIDIPTLEGTMRASADDWIIKGVNGEFYPCKPDIFEKTYQSAEVMTGEQIDVERSRTWKHKHQVHTFMTQMAGVLLTSALAHDNSKLAEPEASAFAKANSDDYLSKVTYGSDEYEQGKKELGAALDHHYEYNQHHIQHWPEGVENMSLLDLCEMIADWKAATLRHDDGDIMKSLEINKERFELSDQLTQILINTVREMGWDK